LGMGMQAQGGAEYDNGGQGVAQFHKISGN
jgi:hypothetical protein